MNFYLALFCSFHWLSVRGSSKEPCLVFEMKKGHETNEQGNIGIHRPKWERGGGKRLMRWEMGGKWIAETHCVTASEEKHQMKSYPNISDSTHLPLQSERRSSSSTRRTPRWALSSMPSTQWHMACITCNGLSAQAIRLVLLWWMNGRMEGGDRQSQMI